MYARNVWQSVACSPPGIAVSPTTCIVELVTYPSLSAYPKSKQKKTIAILVYWPTYSPNLEII